jgi:2,3-bisphosphoglycerate-dependent phosphoglycerate mutase
LTWIYLVRHAHAVWRNDDNRSLSPAGFEAAQLVADRLIDLPITAIYSSPHRRVLETVRPLAERLGLPIERHGNLRERELPVVAAEQFEQANKRTWDAPARALPGGETNHAAQARGVAALHGIIDQHANRHVVLATHGTLLTLMLNGLDTTYGYEFWQQLSFPDIYRLEFQGAALTSVRRMWDDHHVDDNT